MNKVTLSWEGPFSLRTRKGRQEFRPPERPGVYIWAVGKADDLRVSYVGQASNINKRMYTHIHSTLGGTYWLYSKGHLLNGDAPAVSEIYRPGLENILNKFVERFGYYSRVAYDNLVANRIYWAIVEADSVLLRRIESALIARATEAQEPIQNVSVSINSAQQERLSVTEPFPPGTRLHKSIRETQY